MVGDCVSSFLKRRVGLESSSMSARSRSDSRIALARNRLPNLHAARLRRIIAIMAVFFAGQLALSRLSFAIGLRDRPY